MKKKLPSHPIEWFEMCLENRRNKLEQTQKELEKTIETFKVQIENSEKEIKFREFQISEAKRLKKTEFNYNSFANEFYENENTS